MYGPIAVEESGGRTSDSEIKWIQENKHDPMYHYGPQQFFFCFRLLIRLLYPNLWVMIVRKANRYGIENLKYITSHLLEWTYDEGETFDENQKNFIGKYSPIQEVY